MKNFNPIPLLAPKWPSRCVPTRLASLILFSTLRPIRVFHLVIQHVPYTLGPNIKFNRSLPLRLTACYLHTRPSGNTRLKGAFIGVKIVYPMKTNKFYRLNMYFLQNH